jgi:hypothetical protein
VLQKVRDRRGRPCGTILWETKNAKWQETWLSKLRADQRDAKAQISVLVAVQPPAEVETFLEREGVWIVQRRYAKVLACVLRRSLIEIYAERANQAGKDENMEVLYQYLTSIEFQHRIQAIVEGFSHLWKDVETEKRWFATKWARLEKEIRKIIDSTQGMYGDLQAVTGRSLTAIPVLEPLTEISVANSGKRVAAASLSRSARCHRQPLPQAPEQSHSPSLANLGAWAASGCVTMRCTAPSSGARQSDVKRRAAVPVRRQRA